MKMFTTISIIIGFSVLSLMADEDLGWLPLEGRAGRAHEANVSDYPLPQIVTTEVPKLTSDISQFTREYVIDLQIFGISNDGTRPVETSRGINQALQDAKTKNANHIIFPKGLYLISEDDPVVLDHVDTVINLNGATLQINSNSLQKYAVVQIIDGAENMRLTNGTIRGDRDTHDYTEKGTHEWGTGVQFISGRNLEVDNLILADMIGDGMATGTSGTRNRPELLARIKHSIFPSNLEQGAFTQKGEKLASAEKVRTVDPYDLTRNEGEFELGYLAGYMGYPFIMGRAYQAYFFDTSMAFLEKKVCLQYRKVSIPEKAAFMHLEFNQPEIPAEPLHYGAAKGSWVARINNFKPPVNVHFHNNLLTGNRRLGMAICGGQRWLIESNRIEKTGGTAPAFGVDFEDGWELTQDIVFRNNSFKDNQAGDLVICAGTELLIEGNNFESNVVLHGRVHNHTFRRNNFSGGRVSYTTRTGIANIHDNTYTDCLRISITFDNKAVADGLNRVPGQPVKTPPLIFRNETVENVKEVAGTYFCFDNSRFRNSTFVAGRDTRLVQLSNCELIESAIRFEAAGPDVSMQLDDCLGTLEKQGPGLARAKMVRVAD